LRPALTLPPLIELSVAVAPPLAPTVPAELELSRCGWVVWDRAGAASATAAIDAVMNNADFIGMNPFEYRPAEGEQGGAGGKAHRWG
jgi:hypothetical protein